MPTITTNIGRGNTGYRLAVTDARDIPAVYRVWMHETARPRTERSRGRTRREARQLGSRDYYKAQR